MRDLFNLKDKTALITGAAGLLGYEHAVALMSVSCNLVLVDINKSKLILTKKKLLNFKKKIKILTYVVDITDEKALNTLVQKLKKNKIFVEILINNAALDPKMNNLEKKSGTVEKYDVKYLREEIDVGLIGAFLCAKVFGNEMSKRKKGIIINIASDLAILAPDQRVYSKTGKISDVLNFKPIGYPIVKAGMLGLNRYLATYWAHKGIRVNCLVPGAVKNKQSKKLLKEIANRVPMSRLARKDEYRGAIIFLSSKASSYMTGQLLIMDGGRSIW